MSNFYRTKNSTTYEIFKSTNHKNLSKIFFPNKVDNLHKFPTYAVFVDSYNVHAYNGAVMCKWTYFLEIIADKLNTTINHKEIKIDPNSDIGTTKRYIRSLVNYLIKNGTFDFYLNGFLGEGDLESYNYDEMCFLVPLPPIYSIWTLVLILPLDKSTWICLAVTVAVSVTIWKLLDKKSHWNFLFGCFGFFLCKFVEVKT